MSTIITSAREIPAAPYYVLATDSFMSGWGQAAGTKNVVILPCADWYEMKHVRAYCASRSEMKYVRTVYSKPRLNPNYVYSLFDRASAPAWYPQVQEGN